MKAICTRFRVYASLIAVISCISTFMVFSATTIGVPPIQRVALVIGNSDYQSQARLRNPSNDATAMANALHNLGFAVDVKYNLTKKQMRNAVEDFGNRIKNIERAFFYYSGHGMQVNGTNYLIPIDGDINSALDESEVFSLDLLLDQMDASKCKAKVILLDACRNNPFLRRTKSAEKGLAYMGAPDDTLIGYATAPGHTADDGAGNNSPYVEGILQYINHNCMRFDDVLMSTKQYVRNTTNGKQIPWFASSFDTALTLICSQQEQPQQPSRKVLLALDNTASYAGKRKKEDWYDWTVFLCASDKSIFNDIASVEYTLHPTFAHPIQKSTDPTNAFAYSTGGWGEFEMKAKVLFKDNRPPLELKHWLNFDKRENECSSVR